jgi:hypothetical protein
MEDGKPTGVYEDFMTGFVLDEERVWGRPTGLAVTQDGALLVSDDATARFSGLRPKGLSSGRLGPGMPRWAGPPGIRNRCLKGRINRPPDELGSPNEGRLRQMTFDFPSGQSNPC